jgi:hypothetical protein
MTLITSYSKAIITIFIELQRNILESCNILCSLIHIYEIVKKTFTITHEGKYYDNFHQTGTKMT